MSLVPEVNQLFSPLSQGIATDPQKVEMVQKLPTPNNVTELRGFLGLASYYRRYLRIQSRKWKNQAYRFTEKNANFLWDQEWQHAFKELKQKLTSAPILAYLNRMDNLYLAPMPETTASGEFCHNCRE